jgi:phosphoglycolate phosphatase-like HAD superfamily hydrolase
MKLIVFDFDGTLARTSGVDGECFIQAFDEALQIRNFSTSWTDYEHVTDEGVTREIFMQQLGRHPHSAEKEKVIDHFLSLLVSRCDSNRLEFSEVPGAASLVNALRHSGEWAVALATGAWRRSVEFKIQRAGLPITDIPSAFAEDGPSRESIVLTAVERASVHYREQRFERIVSVGDALWDVRTARKLGLPFLGIADEPRASALRKDGASHVVEDYRNAAQCLQFFEEARTPS